MPELEHDTAAEGMHDVGDPPPPGDLLLAVDAGNVHKADGPFADPGPLGDDQSGGGPLTVVGGMQLRGYQPAVGGTAPGDRGHHDAVGQQEVPEVRPPQQRLVEGVRQSAAHGVFLLVIRAGAAAGPEPRPGSVLPGHLASVVRVIKVTEQDEER